MLAALKSPTAMMSRGRRHRVALKEGDDGSDGVIESTRYRYVHHCRHPSEVKGSEGAGGTSR